MIRLSRLADYGVAILTHMARHTEQQHAAPELATTTGVPQPMTSKILKLLARAELVHSTRGAKGGYTLSRSARSITVAEIITALDGPIALTACVEEGAGDCELTAVCAARANWQRINDAIRKALDSITLHDMAGHIPDAFLTPTSNDAPAPSRPVYSR